PSAPASRRRGQSVRLRVIVVLGRLISPYRPAVASIAREQFNLRRIWIHSLDELIDLIWLRTVLATRRRNYRGRTLRCWRTWYVGAGGNQQKLMVIPDVIAEAEAVLHPYNIGFVVESPCCDDLNSLWQMRRCRP